MSPRLPKTCIDLAKKQGGTISRQQALALGVATDTISRLVADGRWDKLQRGVYSIFTGTPDREAMLWAALRRAGPGAVLSHQTAAELDGLTDNISPAIHVTIPVERRARRIPGVVVHRSVRVREAVHPTLSPPRTRIEETVLDLIDQASSYDDALALACAACQRRLTKADRLAAFMARRPKLRWRSALLPALADIRDGAHTLLEHRYLNGVERRHGLPKASRQARFYRGSRRGYRDNLYEDYQVCVELDGRSAHPDDRRWDDIRRDNAAAADGMVTLRYGWADVTTRRCEVAAEVATALTARGWAGQPRSCGPGCVIGGQRAR